MLIHNTILSGIGECLWALEHEGAITLHDSKTELFGLSVPKDKKHGDYSSNVAMKVAKDYNILPRDLATLLQGRLSKNPLIAKIEIAGPGFINIWLTPQAWHQEINEILNEGVSYGDSVVGGKKKVNIEYVSANPTGPMHAGHVRGAVVGDTLARLMQKAGYNVVKEYYFNDAGTQVDVLARTTHLRYREALGENIGTIPEGLYPGEYLKEVGQALAARDGKKWQGQPEEMWLKPVRDFGVSFMISMIRQDLDLIGIHHDVFTNERELIENGTLEKAFKILEERGLIYQGTLPPPRGKEMEDWEPTELTLFRSSQFGDASDRPLKKRDGTWAYIMPDIAYHYYKVNQGYDLIINILGKDHGGWLDRIRPAVAAFSGGKTKLDAVFNSIVKIFKNGEPVKLSKRSGNLITLREMVEEVGAGAVRFFMLSRTPDSELEFDFAKVVEQSRDNPVFYVQYAHARCCSVMRHADVMFPKQDLSQLDKLVHPEELAVVKQLASWPQVVEAAAEAREPHRITYYLIELAGAFHGLWNKGREDARLRFLHENDPALSFAHLALVKATRTVLASGMAVLGVTPLEELRDDVTVAA